MRGTESIVLIFIAVLLWSSCANRIHRGQIIYQISAVGGNDRIETLRVTDGVNVNITEVAGKGVIISPRPGSTISTSSVSSTTLTGKVTDPFRSALSPGSYYLPDKDFSSSAKGYTSLNLSLQAVNITFKNRFNPDERLSQAVRDTFPSTWSSSFSPALAMGYTITRNQYQPDGKKITFDLTIGGFFGFGTTDINNKTTRAPVYNFSRKALTTQKGFYLNLGIQKWDVGYAYGWERAHGDGSESWVFQNQPFHGIIIGYDLVKLRQ
ncbi:hypothetical protein FNH22_18960 [Fulvivirga sp. M361]|uniref:hypothetical protein n=1 Tax=Fulvivirga sp. M361 TaxID=2594266 RepID=UPI00117AD3D7|nr:hypothetical protein [Fulvivirga sp. M361]TRX54836.1 hypothetical protein FNH22_18960 [Fulvivirga sp. M361]